VTFEKTRGLVAAPPTAMHADGAVDLDPIEAQCEMLVRDGVVGAFVCGTTGEGPSLTVGERIAVAERWARVAPDGFRVIVHVGHTCLPDSQALAARAAADGAWGVGAMAPLFFRPASLEDLVDCAARIASAAPGLPFYYYHIPAMTNVDFPMAEFLRAAAGRIPNLAGVKYSSVDLMGYAACLDVDGGRFDCLFGKDEILLSALVLGAEGAIGSTYSFAAPLYGRILDAFRAGDLPTARRLQKRSMAVVRVALRYGFVIVPFKHMMRMVGLDVGPVRPPLRPLPAEQVSALRSELEAVGFFEFCSR